MKAAAHGYRAIILCGVGRSAIRATRSSIRRDRRHADGLHGLPVTKENYNPSCSRASSAGRADQMVDTVRTAPLPVRLQAEQPRHPFLNLFKDQETRPEHRQGLQLLAATSRRTFERVLNYIPRRQERVTPPRHLRCRITHHRLVSHVLLLHHRRPDLTSFPRRCLRRLMHRSSPRRAAGLLDEPDVGNRSRFVAGEAARTPTPELTDDAARDPRRSGDELDANGAEKPTVYRTARSPSRRLHAEPGQRHRPDRRQRPADAERTSAPSATTRSARRSATSNVAPERRGPDRGRASTARNDCRPASADCAVLLC